MIRDKIKEIVKNIDKFKRKVNTFFYSDVEISFNSIPTDIILSSHIIKFDLRVRGNFIDLESEEVKLIGNAIKNILYEDERIENKRQNDLLNSITFKQDDKE